MGLHITNSNYGIISQDGTNSLMYIALPCISCIILILCIGTLVTCIQGRVYRLCSTYPSSSTSTADLKLFTLNLVQPFSEFFALQLVTLHF